MHAYGHEWACQLIYNPQLIQGLGLSDGEGTERLWSRFIKLIGIQQASSVGSSSLFFIYHSTLIRATLFSQRQRHIWLIDRHAAAVANDMVTDLGDWLRRRLKKGIQDQGSVAREILDQCELNVSELRKQWSDQRSAQLSIRSHRS